MPKRIHWKFYENNIKPKLKKKFLELGITHCEVRFPGCTGIYFTALAHSKRRADVYTIEDAEEVILACQHCHMVIDGKLPDPYYPGEYKFWSKEQCTEFVRKKIKERAIF